MVETVFSAAADIANVLLTVIDRDGRIVRFNPACEDVTGYTAAEVTGRRYDSLLPPEDTLIVRQRFERVFAGDFPNSGESVWLTKDGERRVISWWNTALADDDGHVELVVSSGIDITERKRAEDELRRQEERYRTLVEQVPLVIYVDRLDDVSSNVYTSPQVGAILGYDAAEWQDNPSMFVELLHPDDRERVLAEHARVRDSGEPLETEYRLVARDGRVVWFRDGGIVLRGETGEPRYLQGYLLDITAEKESAEERARLEEQLRQSQRMEAVGRLAGGIAHDFNNLLTAIQGYSDLALARLPEHDDLRHELEEIRRAADRAAQLTRQLLAFGRRQMLQPKVLDLNTIVSEMESMLRRLIGEDVELVTVLDPTLGTVRADPSQLQQVLMNLVVNARDAMPRGGRLTVETWNTEIKHGTMRERVALQHGPYALLSVTDTGDGMDAEIRERIFEPFFTTKEAGDGSGLGLATVYGIVKQSGGYIWVDSAPGEGTSFRIYLPLDGRPAEEPPERAEPDPAPPRGAETVLLAEDEDSVRTMVRRVLEEQGYTVLAAASGKEALDLASSHNGVIDLVLTDVVMPGMDGGELVQAVRRLRPDVGSICMSGYAEGSVRPEMLGETTFLQKPFSPSALTRIVRQVLEERVAA
jgi:two-component system cell cycle sensor histidine kinase/response regulator CckA